jgi:hypothetical protein
MTVSNEYEFTREMIQALIKIQEDMLKIPGLSNKQKHDIKKLSHELDGLILEKDDAKIKLQLADIMNRLD